MLILYLPNKRSQFIIVKSHIIICMFKFDLCQVSPPHYIFDKVHLGWENIDKLSLKDTSPLSSCLKTWLILVDIK
jgi:hypothetical protein